MPAPAARASKLTAAHLYEPPGSLPGGFALRASHHGGMPLLHRVMTTTRFSRRLNESLRESVSRNIHSTATLTPHTFGGWEAKGRTHLQPRRPRHDVAERDV
jgi:hypothetical protein